MNKAGSYMKNGILVLISLIWLSPLYIIIVNSFKGRSEMYESLLALPKDFSLRYYEEAIEKINIIIAFGNSLFLTVISIFLIIMLSSMAAWMLARVNSRVSTVIFNILIATMLIPFQTIMMPLMQEMSWMRDTLGLPMLNTRSGLIFMYIGFGASMAIFLYHGFVNTIPISLEEAATIDGCNKWQIFWKIVFPMFKPVTATVAILDVIWIWNDYLLPSLTLTSKDLRTIPLSTAKFFGQYQIEWSMAMAALTMTVIPVVIISVFAQKYIIKGVAAGAVKG